MKILKSTTVSEEDVFTLSFQSYVKGINHKGFNTIAPENTLEAYYLSAKKGFKYVECDISITKDGVPVLLHDSTIDRTSNGTGYIADLTLAQVKALDFGSWKSASYAGAQIPTLEEFLILCRNTGMHPYLELKTNGSYTDANLEKIVDIVSCTGMQGKVSYISFNSAYLSKIKGIDASARLGLVIQTASGGGNVTTLKNLKTTTNEVFVDAGSAPSSSVIQEYRDEGIPFEIWTVDTKGAIEALDPYISGVTSNTFDASYIMYEKATKSTNYRKNEGILFADSVIIEAETSSASATVTVSGPKNTNYYYTTDGTAPTSSSTEVGSTHKITLSSSCTLKVLAVNGANTTIKTLSIAIGS